MPLSSITSMPASPPAPFKKVERQRLSQSVAGELEEAILAGRFEIGARLPSEQTLADQFGVSRNVIREALKMVQTHGLVNIVNGAGVFVAQPNPGTTGAALGRYLRLAGLDSSLGSLYETRKIIEGANARLAAERAHPDDLTALAKCLARMNSSIASMDQWTEADLDFHLGIAHAAHNPFLSMILEPLVGQLHDVIADGYRVPGAVETGSKGHQRIYKALVEHDADAAERAMLQHLEDSRNRILSLMAKQRTRVRTNRAK